jgi:pSer/pThr/pTyr-binding forkhead associated (FHA) protein
VLEDLGSTNGTLLNGRRVEAPQSLRAGDSIDIGAVRLKVDRS